jgi:tRNA A-37 threonylcarbamoyl transferase component Bud32
MTADSGGKPPSGSSPGRPAADTPQRLVVRGENDSIHGASDTAVAIASRALPGEAAPSNGGADSIDHGMDQTIDPSHVGTGPGLRQTPGDGVSKSGPTHTSEILNTTLAGRYLVTKKVGQGGMGAVYEATHTLIGKRVAVKVLLEKYAQREAIVARLKKEAQLASSIGNEHIIDITDIGNTDDGSTFVVMEYLDGESLAECLSREHTLPEQRMLRIASQASSALAAAHAKGIVHRDIKPENLFLLKRKDQDFVKVVDFGISKSLRVSDENEEVQRLTQTGMVLGTPLYMSPEQARGDEDLDHRVDIYALGVIMYEALAGHVPFAGTNYLSVISQVLNEQPKPLRQIRPEISEEFEAIVLKAMAKDRADRYEDADAMLSDLTLLLEDPTHSTERAKITGPRRRFSKAPKIPRVAWAIGGVGVAIAVVMLAVVMLMASGDKHKAAKANTLLHSAIDGGVAAVPIDAAPIVPPVATIKLHIKTEPPGALIYRESELVGKSPAELELVKSNKEVRITAQLDGFADGELDINPLERKDGQTIPMTLKRLPKNAPQPKHIVPGTGSAAQHSGTAGGELNGYPGPK